jgi:diguanylate cyclase (GGDEF)-like protein
MKELNIFIFYLIIAVMIGCITYLDYLIGSSLSLFLLYVFPIYLVSWYKGRASGFVIAFVTGLLWRVVDIVVNTYTLNITYLFLGTLSRILIFSLIAYLIAYNSKLYYDMKQLAYTDQKTGDYNYRAFIAFSEKMINNSVREETPISIAYFDMDHFKEVNDLYGHNEGDQVLLDFSTLVKKHIRTSDIFARIGGDEFVALFVGSEAKEACIVLNRINQAFSELMVTKGYHVTLSIGIMNVPKTIQTIETYIKEVDQLMYKAKLAGRNQIYMDLEL